MATLDYRVGARLTKQNSWSGAQLARCSSSMQEAMGLSPWHQGIVVHSVIPGRRSQEVQVEGQPVL